MNGSMYMRVSENDTDRADDVHVVVPTTESDESKNYWHVDPWALVLKKLEIKSNQANSRAWIMKRGCVAKSLMKNGTCPYLTDKRRSELGDHQPHPLKDERPNT